MFLATRRCRWHAAAVGWQGSPERWQCNVGVGPLVRGRQGPLRLGRRRLPHLATFWLTRRPPAAVVRRVEFARARRLFDRRPRHPRARVVGPRRRLCAGAGRPLAHPRVARPALAARRPQPHFRGCAHVSVTSAVITSSLITGVDMDRFAVTSIPSAFERRSGAPIAVFGRSSRSTAAAANPKSASTLARSVAATACGPGSPLPPLATALPANFTASAAATFERRVARRQLRQRAAGVVDAGVRLQAAAALDVAADAAVVGQHLHHLGLARRRRRRVVEVLERRPELHALVRAHALAAQGKVAVGEALLRKLALVGARNSVQRHRASGTTASSDAAERHSAARATGVSRGEADHG